MIPLCLKHTQISPSQTGSPLRVGNSLRFSLDSTLHNTLGHAEEGLCRPVWGPAEDERCLRSPPLAAAGQHFVLQPDIGSQQTKRFPASLLCTRKRFLPFLGEALHACCHACEASQTIPCCLTTLNIVLKLIKLTVWECFY